MGDSAGIGWLHLSELRVDRQGGPTTRSEIRELLEQDLRRVHAVSGPWDLVAWSPEGLRIAATSSLGTLVLGRNGRTPIARAAVPSLAAIAWSPDGSRLAMRSRSHVYIWTVHGARLRRNELSCPTPAAMAWTASGELALGSYRGTYLWNPHDADIQDRSAPGSAAPRTQEAAAPVLALAVSLRRRIGTR